MTSRIPPREAVGTAWETGLDAAEERMGRQLELGQRLERLVTKVHRTRAGRAR
jgi:hypothetical protein